MEAVNTNFSKCGFGVHLSIVAVLLVIVCPSSAWSQDAYWTGGSGDWFDSGNWQFSDLPDANQPGFITNSGTVTVSSLGAEAKRLTIGDSMGSGSLIIDGGVLNLTAGGTAGNMNLANGAGSVGSLSIISGSLEVRANLRVGRVNGSTATVTQTGGSVNISVLEMGSRDGASIYTISDGMLTFDRAEFYNDNNSTSSFILSGGTVQVDNTFWETKLRSSGGGSTAFTQTGGVFTSINDISVGNGGSGTAVWSQSGGTALVTERYGIKIKSQGAFNLSETGELTTTTLLVEGGRFIQSGGTFETTSADGVYIYDGGRFEVGGSGQVTTSELTVGQRVPENGKGSGFFTMSSAAADVSVSGRFSVGPEGSFTAVPGAAIHFTGSAFENLSTSESALSGLENTTFVFEGGTDHWSRLEVAGRDIGLQPSGFDSNFALGNLVIGGADEANLRLQDLVDNGNRSSSEALYVHDVTLAAGSTLDMNNLNLYFNGMFTDHGGTIINGEPEPGTDPVPVRSVSAEDVSGSFTPDGGTFGLGEFSITEQANVVVGRDVGQITYAGGSFSMSASLQVDLSKDGSAGGKFGDGEICFMDAGDGEILVGSLIELTLLEVGDDRGMLAGRGLFEVTGGKFQDAFGQSQGDVFQMLFQIEPTAFDDFAGSFTGFTNITVAPVPEPATFGLLTVGALAVLRRRRRNHEAKVSGGRCSSSSVLIAVMAFAVMTPAVCFGGLGVWPGYDSVDLGRPIIVPDDAEYVVARYYGNWGGSPFELYLDQPDNDLGMLFDKTYPFGTEVNLGEFTPGTELVFRTLRNGSDTFYSGPASRNFDNTVHAAAIPQSYGYMVGWEGLPNGGDNDYDDFVIDIDFYESSPPPNASIEISALIDGRDQLIIRDGTLQWDHFDMVAVGRHMGQNVPTTITTTIGDQSVMDHVDWTPEWSVSPPGDVRNRELSSVFTGLLPEFPELEQTVKLTPLNVRRDASIVQQPSVGNDYTLIVEFNDNTAGSSDMYTLRLDYYDPEWEPEPLRSVGVLDVAVEFTPSGGVYGLGLLTSNGQVDVIVEDAGGEQTSYLGGSFEMTTSLASSNTSGSLAVGEFRGGDIVFLDSNGADLLAGDFIELTLYELDDDWGMLSGDGLFKVTGGSLQDDFVESYGEVFQMLFDIPPSGLDNFSSVFTGFANITITPTPEPATMAMLAVGALAVFRRKRRR